MSEPPFSNVRRTIYIHPDTDEELLRLAGTRPVGWVVDELVGTMRKPVAALIACKTDRVPVKPYAGPPPALKPSNCE